MRVKLEDGKIIGLTSLGDFRRGKSCVYAGVDGGGIVTEEVQGVWGGYCSQGNRVWRKLTRLVSAMDFARETIHQPKRGLGLR